jgi:DNA mismatch repair ATPase MutS
VFITGANQGGKSTFLRSVGLAQLMMQCGMFVAAESFSASVCAGIHTHYKREEDATMTSGKLDEELRRMSETVDLIRPGSMLLCNESFASTNEREGSEIARHIIGAMVESGVKVLFVTHFFDLADLFYREDPKRALFLRAERMATGRRTFRLCEGGPEPTSHARDIYERTFGAARPPQLETPGCAGV